MLTPLDSYHKIAIALEKMIVVSSLCKEAQLTKYNDKDLSADIITILSSYPLLSQKKTT